MEKDVYFFDIHVVEEVKRCASRQNNDLFDAEVWPNLDSIHDLEMSPHNQLIGIATEADWLFVPRWRARAFTMSGVTCIGMNCHSAPLTRSAI